MSADIIEPVSSTDIVRRVSEVYLTDSHEKFKKSRIQPGIKRSKAYTFATIIVNVVYSEVLLWSIWNQF